MKFLTGCLLIAFLLGAYTYSYAQADGSGIHGKVTDEKHIGAEAATVILLAAADSAIIRSTACDADGRFKFNANPGKYLLLISKIGFDQSLTGPYTITPGKDVGIKEISLVLHLPQLKEVSITAQRSYVEVKPGKVVLNVQSSIIADGNSVAEILKQAPGVHIDTRGNLSIIGRQGALVIIDGKQVNVSGQDLSDLLQSMPGNTVQQIELITNPSAKYEASGGGVINIILRKGVNAGTNFTLNGSAGYGTYYKASAGLVFNNRMGNINIFGNYNYLEDKNFHDFITDRNINYKGFLSNYYADYHSIRVKKTHTFRLGTDIAISPNHSIGLLISGTVDNFDYSKNNVLNITNQGHLDSVISTTAKTSQGKSNISYDINYSGKLDKKGKLLSADLIFNNIDRHTFEYIDNYFNTAAGTSYRPALYLQNLSPSSINIWAAKIDYTNPLSKNSQLDAGIKYSNVKSNNDLIFGPKVNGVYTSSPQFSNTFIYTENINSAYATYTNKIGKVNLMAGLRAEQTISNGNSLTMMSAVKKNYVDWFPHVQLNYTVNDKNELNFSYDRGINRALYEQINPFRRYVDLYDYTAGNPNLLPQYTDKIELTHIYNKTLVTSLYGMTTTNYYNLNNLLQNDSTKVSITTNSNFGTYSILGIRIFAPVVFTSWWDANFAIDASYQRIKAYPQYGNLNKGTQDILFSGTQNFKISNTLTAQLLGKYESPTFFGIGQFRSVYRIDAAVSKQLFNKRAALRLNVNDIFNTQRDYDVIKYQNLNATLYDKVESRWFKLSFSSKFGNNSLKSNAKHSAGNEDEQNRAGGVAGSGNSN
jgi:iron complex outermembrane receptor protein